MSRCAISLNNELFILLDVHSLNYNSRNRLLFANSASISILFALKSMSLSGNSLLSIFNTIFSLHNSRLLRVIKKKTFWLNLFNHSSNSVTSLFRPSTENLNKSCYVSTHITILAFEDSSVAITSVGIFSFSPWICL